MVELQKILFLLSCLPGFSGSLDFPATINVYFVSWTPESSGRTHAHALHLLWHVGVVLLRASARSGTWLGKGSEGGEKMKAEEEEKSKKSGGGKEKKVFCVLDAPEMKESLTC